MRPASVSSTRARPTLLIVLAASLFLARLVAGAHEAFHPPPAGGLVNWRAIDGAATASAAEHKPILYDFSATWCEPCRQMEREVFANPEAASLINSSYIPVRVADDDRSTAATDLGTKHEVEGLPTLIVMRDATGEPRRMEGYPGKRRTLAFLKRAIVQKPTANSKGGPQDESNDP
jgi:thiol:disulfide interchange protein